jgi:hypothetical protein
MNNSNNKRKCSKKCQTILRNQPNCFPKYNLKNNNILQYLFTSMSEEQENIELLSYEVKSLNVLKTHLQEVLISNIDHENTSNPSIPKNDFNEGN